MSYTIESPFQYFPDPTKFGTLGLGSLYIGVTNGSPYLVPAQRQQVYIAVQGGADLPISQPIALGAGGVPLYNGSPCTLKISAEYSVAVVDYLGAQIYYSPRNGDEITAIDNLQTQINNLELNEQTIINTWAAISSTPVSYAGQLFYLRQHTSGGFGSGTLMAVSGSVSDDGGTQKNSASANFYLKRVGYSSVSVDMFGAIGDSTTNDSAAFSAAFASPNNKGSVGLESRSYKITGNVVTNSTVKELWGAGAAKIICSSQSGGQESLSIYNVNDFTMRNITFTADNINTVKNPLAFVGNATNVQVFGCEFVNTGGIGIGIANSVSVMLKDNYFYNTGFGSLTFPYSSAPAVIAQTTSSDVKLVNNRFELTNWSAAYFFPDGGLIDGNICIGCRESTFYCEGAKHIRIVNNKIQCGAGVNIANFGIEYGQGFDFVIANNEIEGGQDAAIGITNANKFTISNNICYNSGKGMGAVTYASAGILFREFVNVAVSSSKNGTVSGNVCFDDQPTKTQRYGMSFYVDPGAQPIRDIVVDGNNLLNNLTAPMYIDADTTLFQDTCIFRNNRGYAETPKTITFAMTSGSTGLKTFGGFGFKPRAIRIQGQATTPDNSWVDIMIVPNGSTAVTDGFSYFSALQHQATFCNLRAGAGTLILGADWTGGAATTKDGFTYNYTNNNVNHTLTITCYP